MTTKSFGGRLKLARIDAGLTEKQAASLVGYGTDLIRNLEKITEKDDLPVISLIEMFSRMYNVSIYWLITGKSNVVQPAQVAIDLVPGQSLTKEMYDQIIDRLARLPSRIDKESAIAVHETGQGIRIYDSVSGTEMNLTNDEAIVLVNSILKVVMR